MHACVTVTVGCNYYRLENCFEKLFGFFYIDIPEVLWYSAAMSDEMTA